MRGNKAAWADDNMVCGVWSVQLAVCFKAKPVDDSCCWYREPLSQGRRLFRLYSVHA